MYSPANLPRSLSIGGLLAGVDACDPGDTTESERPQSAFWVLGWAEIRPFSDCVLLAVGSYHTLRPGVARHIVRIPQFLKRCGGAENCICAELRRCGWVLGWHQANRGGKLRFDGEVGGGEAVC